MSDTVDSRTLDLFERSLARCEARPGFLDLFYEKFMASSPEVAQMSGGYFSKRKPIEPSAAARDPEAGRHLWQESARLVGLPES